MEIAQITMDQSPNEIKIDLTQPVGTDAITRLPRGQLPAAFWRWWHSFSRAHPEVSIDLTWDAWAAGAAAAATWNDRYGNELRAERGRNRKMAWIREMMRRDPGQ